MDLLSGNLKFLELVADMTLDMRVLALQWGAVLAFIVMFFGVGKLYLGIDKELNFTKFIGIPILTLLAIRFYPLIIDIIGQLVFILLKSLDVPEINFEDFWVNSDPPMKKGDSGGLLGIAETLNYYFHWLTNWLFNLPENMLRGLITTILIIGRAVMEQLGIVYLSFLIIIGPLAYMMSIVPMFEGIMKLWFKNYLNASMWFLVIGILDKLLLGFTGLGQMMAEVGTFDGKAYAHWTWGTTEGSGANMVKMLIFALMYLITPFLSAKITGATQSGKFMSGVIGVGTAVASKVIAGPVKGTAKIFTGGKGK